MLYHPNHWNLSHHTVSNAWSTSIAAEKKPINVHITLHAMNNRIFTVRKCFGNLEYWLTGGICVLRDGRIVDFLIQLQRLPLEIELLPLPSVAEAFDKEDRTIATQR